MTVQPLPIAHASRMPLRLPAVSWHGLASWLTILGLILLPFSTRSARDQFAAAGSSIAISYGMPWFGLAAAVIGLAFVAGVAAVPSRIRVTLLVALAHVGVVVWFSAYSPSLGGLIARCAGMVLGCMLFLFLCSLSAAGDDRAERRYQQILWAIVLSGAVMAAYYIGNFVARSATYGVAVVIGSRIVGGLASLPWHASNIVGGAMLYPLCMLFHLAPRTALERVGVRISMTLILAALTLTMSLGAIGSAMAFLVFALPKHGRLRVFAGLALSLVLAIGVLRLAVGEDFGLMVERAFQFQNDKGDISNNRFDSYHDAIVYFSEHPGQPVGYGAAGQVIIPDGTHNIWLSYLVEMGPVGVLSLAALVAVLVRRALWLLFGPDAATRRSGWLFLLWLGTVFLHMMVETPIYTQQAAIYFWVAAGLLVARSVRASASADRTPAASAVT